MCDCTMHIPAIHLRPSETHDSMNDCLQTASVPGTIGMFIETAASTDTVNILPAIGVVAIAHAGSPATNLSRKSQRQNQQHEVVYTYSLLQRHCSPSQSF